MAEEWFEDELPWLGPPPQLPPRREQPQPTPPARRTPPPARRRPVSAQAAATASAALPRMQLPEWTPDLAVPPYARIQQRRYGEVVALKWAGVLLILVAALTALALIVRDIRAGGEVTPVPTAQLVIPAASELGGGSAASEIVANPLFVGKVICLDAAHGGSDRGFKRTGDASAPAMDEALYTAAYTRELADRLTAMGFTVVTTRDGDTVRNEQFQDVNRDGLTRENATTDADAAHNALIDEMQARIDFCNDEEANLLISLHFDGSSNGSDSGFSTWYAEGRADSMESQRLAQLINQEIGADLAAAGYVIPDLGVIPESTAALRGNQMLYDSLFMITGNRNGMKDPSRMPGVVADLLTISNSSDAQVLVSDAGRAAMVTAMADAIGRYFSEQPAG
ncbi:MAG: N-acetylmuramoyl-L-alanine amidase [Thermomicrobiales bacterium]